MKGKSSKGTRLIWALMATLVVTLLTPGLALAVSPKLMQGVIVPSEGTVKLYVRDANGLEDGSTLQVGPSEAAIISAEDISKDAVPPRTLFILDNSLSVGAKAVGRLKQVMLDTVSDHAKGETFKVVMLGEEPNYLADSFTDDYTALKNSINNIEGATDYQNAYMADVLEQVVLDLMADKYEGYTRIVLMADGIDKKDMGVTSGELRDTLKDARFPLYCIAKKADNNADALEEMQSLSKLTGGEFRVLGDSEDEELVDMLGQDHNMTVFVGQIPADLRTGSEMGAKLTLRNGDELTCDIRTPFRDLDEEAEPEAPRGVSPMRLVLIVAAAVLAGAAIATAVAMQSKRKREREESDRVALQHRNNQPYGTTAPQVVVAQAPQPPAQTLEKPVAQRPVATPAGVPAVPVPGDGQTITANTGELAIVLADVDDRSRVFRAAIVNEVSVGRANTCTLRIADDNAVGRKHCTFILRDGMFFVRDDGSANGIIVNGVRQQPRIDVVITNGSAIVIGRHQYQVFLVRG